MNSDSLLPGRRRFLKQLGAGTPGYTGIYNSTGWPSAVVRAGTSPEGLPIGIQMLAHPWNEHVSLAAAAALESHTGG